MPSTTTMVILATATGAGVYYAYARPIEEKKEKWVEPKHEKSPEVTIFIKPDDAPSHTTFTNVKTGEILNPIKYKPGSFRDKYGKKRGQPPGW